MISGRIKRRDQRSARLPIIGKVKIGKKTEQGYPTSLNHFIAIGKYDKYFSDAYGFEPNKLEVVFFTNNISEACNERWECRDPQGKLAGYGDGETFDIYNAVADKYEKTQDKEIIKKAGKWEAILTITFLLLKIRGVFGCWQLSTKGERSSIPSIRDTFDMVMSKAGTVIGIPFDLCIEKVKSQKPGSKNLYPVITLVPNVSSQHLEMLASYVGSDLNNVGILTEEKIEQIKQKSLKQ